MEEFADDGHEYPRGKCRHRASRPGSWPGCIHVTSPSSSIPPTSAIFRTNDSK